MALFSRSFKKRGYKIVAAGLALLAVAAVISGCSAQAASKIKATWVSPQVSGETLSIQANDIAKSKIVHFTVKMALGSENFMAYDLGGQTFVRANVCPPCRSIGFSLAGDKLVCDSCGTVFKAQTGDGVSGACVAYPKAAVPFQNAGGTLTMQLKDLQAAYQNTLEPGWP